MNINLLFFDETDTGNTKKVQIDSFDVLGKLCSDIEHGRLTDKDISSDNFADYISELSKAFYKAEHSRKTKDGIRRSKERKAKRE